MTLVQPRPVIVPMTQVCSWAKCWNKTNCLKHLCFLVVSTESSMLRVHMHWISSVCTTTTAVILWLELHFMALNGQCTDSEILLNHNSIFCLFREWVICPRFWFTSHQQRWTVHVKTILNKLFCCRQPYSKDGLCSSEMLSRRSCWSPAAPWRTFLQHFSSPVSTGYIPRTSGKWVSSDHWRHKNCQWDCRLDCVSAIEYLIWCALVLAITSQELGWMCNLLITQCLITVNY